MAKRKVETGPTADAVKANMARVRKGQGLTLREVSERLAVTDRPLSHNAISEIERGARRVDVDDLSALARALGVSPLTLLMPKTNTPEQSVTATGVGEVQAIELWQWMRTELPIGYNLMDVMQNLEFQWRSKPSWYKPELTDRRSRYTSDHLRAAADEYDQAVEEGRDGDD